MIQPKLVVFDWDGVIVDSVPSIHRAMCRTCESFGVPAPSFTEFYRNYRSPWGEYYRSIGITHPEPEIEERYFSFFDDRAAPLIEGALEVVEALALRGVRLAIVSADSRNRIRPALERLGVTAFDGRVVERAFHKTEALRNLCVSLGTDMEEAAFIGDMVSDVLHGKEAGLTTVGFAPAHRGTKPVLYKHGADYCVEDHGELALLLGV